MKRVKQIVMMAFASLLAQCVWAELTTDFLYTGNGNGSTTGWFTGWDGEGFANNRRAIGPGNMGLVFAADHVNNNVKWHPYKGYQVPETFSIALYTDLSVVSNPDTETAALFAAGGNSGNRAILYKHGNKVGLATNGGDVETDIPTEGGYHLYTVTYTSDKITIAIDNGTPVEKTGTFARPANGFQIAGIYGGVGSWKNPRGLPVAALIGFAKVLSAEEMTELTTTYPATAETTLTSELAYNQDGGIIYAGTITHNSKLSIKRGMLTIPAGADCKVKAIDFGDTQGTSGTFGLDLDGALTITGVSSKSDANQGNNSVKNAYVNGEGGFLGGDWEGSGTYNIRGTLTIADSYMQPIHDAGMQTYNIEDGGVLIVKGIQAGTFHAKSTPQHVFNVKNGGLLQVKTALSLNTINAVVEEGGTLELTDTFDHMLNNSNLGGVTCAGKLKLTGTHWVMLPTDATKAANLAAIAEIENNISGDDGQILLSTASTYTIGSLSGTGGVRADYAPNAARTLKIVQSKDTTWTGAVKDDSNAARIINFEVASENGSALTMSGTYTGNNVRTGVLTVDEGGAVKLTKVWPTAGFNINGTLTIDHGVWQPVYMVKGTGTINWAGTNTFSVNAADGDDALILDGTTINQTAGTLSLRAPGNRTDDSHQDNIGYIKNATITSSSTLSCSGKIGVKGACSITKTAGACLISTIELSEEGATLVLDGVTMTVTSYDVTKRVVTTSVEGGTKYSLETIQPEPPTPTEGGITPSIPGAQTIVIVDVNDNPVTGGKIPLTTGVYTVTGKVGDTVVGTQNIGVVAAKAAETTTDRVTTAVAVPFKGKTVATLLNTALLKNGDTLMAWVDGAYATWTLNADKEWVGQDVINGAEAKPATTALKCGQAVWVTTAGQIVTFGDTAATGDTVEVTTGHNLLGSIAYTEAVPQTAAENDQVQLIGEVDAKGNEVITRYNKTSTGWVSKIQKRFDAGNGVSYVKEETSNEAPTVKPGRGYWLIHK